MDVYHKILSKLYQLTGGKQSESVDFVELVKNEGFFPSYEDIYRQLSRNGWIADTGSGNKVKLTHWGIKEAKKSQTGGPDSTRETKKMANRLKEEVKELLVMSEEFASDLSEDRLKQVESKLRKIAKAIDEIKPNI